jgi:cytoskeletal protein CcmA (bactofilin family)
MPKNNPKMHKVLRFSTIQMRLWRVEFSWPPKRNSVPKHIFLKGRISSHMWKPTNQPTAPGRPTDQPERTPISAPSAPAVTETAVSSAPRPVSASTADQATIGKSLVIKGEVTGSESLYIDGRVEGSINLAGNRVTVGRNGVVAANITAREIVVLGKVRGNLTASDRVDIRSDGSLTGDVVAARISIEDGAFFKGGIDIRKAGQAGKPNGEEKPVSSNQAEVAAARA